jgi:hypothetical protein
MGSKTCLHTGPEGQGGFVIPGVDNAASDMFSLGRSLLNTRGFTDVDGQIGLGSAVVDVAASAAACESWVRHAGAVVVRVV